jgi:hypothetical protein
MPKASGIVPVDNWKEVVNTYLKIDGYVIHGTTEKFEIGVILCDRMTDVPWKIIGEATYEDAVRQFKILASMARMDEDVVLPPPNYLYYKTVPAD